jgi:hypothetical protein
MAHQLSHDDQMRLIGATHEAARILVWVRQELGRLREIKRLIPERHTKRHQRIDDTCRPLESLERRITKEHQEMQSAYANQKH